MGATMKAAPYGCGFFTKPPKGQGTPWRPYVKSFWKVHLINPPDVQGQVVRLIGDRWEPVTCNLKILLSAKKVKDKILLWIKILLLVRLGR